jgi:tRNA pseudouridine38-40 synthase
MCPPVRLWAVVEYDGTDFFGFQIQPHRRTVQGELERALGQVTGRAIRVIGAGRTDRGVHARGQVIGFEVSWRHELPDLQRALNAVLAADVAVLQMGKAPSGFHPRFSATSRAYRYTLLRRSLRSPLGRRSAWHCTHELDIERMAQASRCLQGTHDFASFGRPPQGENTVRTVFRAEWHEHRPFVLFDIEANAFLYRMVRSLVGMLVQVGSGQMASEEFEAMLEARDRCLVKKVAPPQGLCLMGIEYGRREGVL